jgi:hypothetical protein
MQSTKDIAEILSNCLNISLPLLVESVIRLLLFMEGALLLKGESLRGQSSLLRWTRSKESKVP